MKTRIVKYSKYFAVFIKACHVFLVNIFFLMLSSHPMNRERSSKGTLFLFKKYPSRLTYLVVTADLCDAIIGVFHSYVIL
jgi:hypothetical protein